MSLGRVMVVDDQPLVIGILRDMLRYLQYEATTAASAEDALAAIVNVRPHVVLLDLQLAGLSGLEALAYFRAHYPTVPVIIVSGSLESETVRQVRDGGAFDILVKPFGLADLRDLMARAMTLAPP